ncbi:hypothetical protein KIN20_010991 [Parelaphostrongylus tenuis]|uniref:Uncharacterized protein n=1 Tax=Parelaphostrongylus tenuis TaxID=148309 RepID=A0AAD5MAE5_PARTN|nr:hypothetical protein KIN20_010991 [Parelaphostrongylus tenuis]
MRYTALLREQTVNRLKNLCPSEQRFGSKLSFALNTNLKDQLRSGRPSEVDRAGAIKAIGKDPILTIEELADDCECGNATISKILKTAGKK